MDARQAVPLFLVGGVAVAAALWVAQRQREDGGSLARDVGASAGRAVIQAADGAVSGAVVTIGEAVGIPATNSDQCARDLAAGDLWSASFSCPAPRFFAALSSGNYGQAAAGQVASGNTGGATGSW